MFVIEGEGFVIIINRRQIWVNKNVGQSAPFTTLLRLYFAIAFSLPSTFPLILISPIFWITNAWLGFNVIKPGIFNTTTRSPNILACNRASVTTNAFVEI